jgi:hypothetical protein
MHLKIIFLLTLTHQNLAKSLPVLNKLKYIISSTSFPFLGELENYKKLLLASSYLSFFRPSLRSESLDSN